MNFDSERTPNRKMNILLWIIQGLLALLFLFAGVTKFTMSIEAFVDVLQRALPEQSRPQLYWKLDLVIAVLIRVQSEAGQTYALLKGTDPEDIQTAIEQLVKFLSPGMRS